MLLKKVTRKWRNRINVVTIGNEDEAIQVGGETTLPFLHDEGEMPHRPVIALEVYDSVPDNWTDTLLSALGNVVNDPVAWAKKGKDEWGVDLISLRFLSHALAEDSTSPEECAQLARSVKDAVKLPMIIWGSGEQKADNEMYPVVSQAMAGERCLFASATENNYKVLAATCIADGHSIIGESPIDINICKQVNILLSDMGLPSDRIAIYTANGSLGYGFEYAYSIMERTRIAALDGDKLMAMPIIAMIGSEVQRTKEVKATQEEIPQWGSEVERGVAWETTTAVSYLQAGADILTMCNPRAIELTRNYIDEFWQGRQSQQT